jgi:hypothetical protein
VDFGDTVRLNTVVLTEVDHRTRGYQLYVWTGEGWTLTAQGRLIGHQAARIVRFPTVAGSRMRVAFAAGVLSPVINEVEVYLEPHRGCGLNPAHATPGWAEHHQCPN